jgi:hypothetical protein
MFNKKHNVSIAKCLISLICILILLCGCSNNERIIYNCSLNKENMPNISTEIESDRDGNILKISEIIDAKIDEEKETVDEIISRYENLKQDYEAAGSGIKFSYKFSDDKSRVTITTIIDVREVDENYQIDHPVYGHGGSMKVDELIESIENGGATCNIE